MLVLRPEQLTVRGREGALRRGSSWLAGLLVASILIAGCTAETGDATRSGPVLVGIVDTGVVDGALPGVIDRASSRSVVTGEDLGDHDGHGTEMAWIVHRTAPEAKLAAVKAIDRHGATSDAQLARAVTHLRSQDARVILISLAGAEPLPRTRDAIAAAGEHGVLVVAAAGNEGLDLDRFASYPGGYDLPNLVTVAATDGTGRLLGSANRGAGVDVLARGRVPTCSLGGDPTVSTGTSAAAATVAGLAATHWAEGARSMAERRARLEAVGPAHASPLAAECTWASERSEVGVHQGHD